MDTQKMMAGFINAKAAEDRLKELGSDNIPKNFTMMQAMFSSMSANPMFANMFLANEFKKYIPEASKNAKTKFDTKQEELDTANANIKEMEIAMKKVLAHMANNSAINTALTTSVKSEIMTILPKQFQAISFDDFIAADTITSAPT